MCSNIHSENVLLPPSVELLDRTQLVKKLLIDQPWHLQELVVGDKLIHDLSLHPSGLKRRSGRECDGYKAKNIRGVKILQND